MDQTFFGFKPADRAKLHEILFDLVWHGEGRWDLETIYSMPLPMRRFWIQKYNSIIEKRNANNNNTTTPQPAKNIQRGPDMNL